MKAVLTGSNFRLLASAASWNDDCSSSLVSCTARLEDAYRRHCSAHDRQIGRREYFKRLKVASVTSRNAIVYAIDDEVWLKAGISDLQKGSDL